MWVAVELARARITGFPWDLLGYTQIDNIPLTRIATVTGVFGVSWIVALVNCAFTLAIFRFSQQSLRLLLASLAAAVALQSGTFVKPEALPADQSAVLLQENLPVDFAEWTAEYYDRTIASLVQLSSPQLIRPQDDAGTLNIVIWPESPAPFYSVDPKFRHWMTALAADAHAYLIVGSLGVNPARDVQQHAQVFNSAVLVSPAGEITARYDKIHLVPFGEYIPFKSFFVFAEKLTKEVSDFSRGSQRTVFNLGNHKAGTFICYESIFPDEVRQFASNGAELFVNISNDGWFGESGAPGQHLNMARMRAIENGRWLLRSTNTGITGSIDPFGRVVVRAQRNLRTALRAEFGFTNVTTFYTRLGDWFAFGCAIISLAVVIFAGRRS
jgi:apolipoprotein N-acyltransferase